MIWILAELSCYLGTNNFLWTDIIAQHEVMVNVELLAHEENLVGNTKTRGSRQASNSSSPVFVFATSLLLSLLPVLHALTPIGTVQNRLHMRGVPPTLRVLGVVQLEMKAAGEGGLEGHLQRVQ